MTLLKKFNDTGQEIGSEDVPINETNFQLYIEQFGQERAQGYMDAFVDILKQIHGTVHRENEYGDDWRVSDQVAGRRVEKLHDQNSLTLEKMTQLLSDSKLKL